MRINAAYVFLFLTLIFFIWVEWYGYMTIEQAFSPPVWVRWVFHGTLLFLPWGFYYRSRLEKGSQYVRPFAANFWVGFAISLLILKWIICLLSVLHDAGRFSLSILQVLYPSLPTTSLPYDRLSFLNQAIVAFAGLCIFPMLYGITKGKYRFKVKNIDLVFSDLPVAFDGYRIAQITDIHAGSFDNVAEVKKGIDLLKEQQADMIVFTGDLVNGHKDEIEPFMPSFQGLEAPDGAWCVKGNHDYYGAYTIKDKEEKKRYWADFEDKLTDMGFTLLDNAYKVIRRGEEAINLVGVENWGIGPFPKKGDLDVATHGLEPRFTVLLSHDPSHWDHHIINHPYHFHLTLAGHTHALQFGFKIFGLVWSPVKFRYKRWLGLYKEAEKLLYVNPGFGLLGFPGRVGMWPEITVFTLRKG